MGQKFERINFCWLVPLTTSVILLIFFFYPLLMGRGITFHPLRGNISTPQERYLSSNGYLEISVAGGFKFVKHKNITLFLRRRDYDENKRVNVKVNINDKNIYLESFRSRNIKIVLDERVLKKHLYTGSNHLSVAVESPEFFTLRMSVD
jgi:hypothetical protein